MRTAIGLIVLWAALSLSGFAVCGHPQPRLVCAEYFASQVVVEAKLVRTKAIGDKQFVTANVYYMRTEKLLRGSIGPEFEIYEGNDSGRAEFDWEDGDSYLLFLFPSADTKRHAWGLDGCGNSGPLEKRHLALQEIKALQKRSGGMIQIAVGGDVFSWSPAITGAELNAQGMNGTFSATTNNKGIAEIRVPPGNYSLSVTGEKQYEPYVLTYEQPSNIEIENGSCAQVQFVEAGK